MIGRDDSEFCKKCGEILDHCSMILMLLIIESTKKEMVSLSKKKQKAVRWKFDKKQLDDLQRKTEEKLDKFSMQ